MDNVRSSLGPQYCGQHCPACGTSCRLLIHHGGTCECPGCGQRKFTIDPVGHFAISPPAPQARRSYVNSYSAPSAASSPAAEGASDPGGWLLPLVWTLTKVVFWAVAVIAICTLVAAAVAAIVVVILSAVVVAALGVWLRLYVKTALIRVQIRILKWAALIGGLGGAGLVYASFSLPPWFVDWANQFGGDLSLFLKAVGIVLVSLPVLSLAVAKLQLTLSAHCPERATHTGYGLLTVLAARVFKRNPSQVGFVNFIQDFIIAGVPIFFAWRSGGFWMWIYASALALAEIVYLRGLERILRPVNEWFGDGDGTSEQERELVETAIH